RRLARDGASLVASLVAGQRRGPPQLRLPARPLEQTPPLAARARSRAAGADLRLPPPHRLGPPPGRGRDRLRTLDRLEGASPARTLAAPAAAAGAGPTLRVALSRRPAAHGRQPPCALPAARPRRHRRSLAALA